MTESSIAEKYMLIRWRVKKQLTTPTSSVDDVGNDTTTMTWTNIDCTNITEIVDDVGYHHVQMPYSEISSITFPPYLYWAVDESSKTLVLVMSIDYQIDHNVSAFYATEEYYFTDTRPRVDNRFFCIDEYVGYVGPRSGYFLTYQHHTDNLVCIGPILSAGLPGTCVAGDYKKYIMNDTYRITDANNVYVDVRMRSMEVPLSADGSGLGNIFLENSTDLDDFVATSTGPYTISNIGIAMKKEVYLPYVTSNVQVSQQAENQVYGIVDASLSSLEFSNSDSNEFFFDKFLNKANNYSLLDSVFYIYFALGDQRNLIFKGLLNDISEGYDSVSFSIRDIFSKLNAQNTFGITEIPSLSGTFPSHLGITTPLNIGQSAPTKHTYVFPIANSTIGISNAEFLAEDSGQKMGLFLGYATGTYATTSTNRTWGIYKTPQLYADTTFDKGPYTGTLISNHHASGVTYMAYSDAYFAKIRFATTAIASKFYNGQSWRITDNGTSAVSYGLVIAVDPANRYVYFQSYTSSGNWFSTNTGTYSIETLSIPTVYIQQRVDTGTAIWFLRPYADYTLGSYTSIQSVKERENNASSLANTIILANNFEGATDTIWIGIEGTGFSRPTAIDPANGTDLFCAGMSSKYAKKVGEVSQFISNYANLTASFHDLNNLDLDLTTFYSQDIEINSQDNGDNESASSYLDIIQNIARDAFLIYRLNGSGELSAVSLPIIISNNIPVYSYTMDDILEGSYSVDYGLYDSYFAYNIKNKDSSGYAFWQNSIFSSSVVSEVIPSIDTFPETQKTYTSSSMLKNAAALTDDFRSILRDRKKVYSFSSAHKGHDLNIGDVISINNSRATETCIVVSLVKSVEKIQIKAMSLEFS